ncbi:hypothetical protein [Plesiomonas shigelloides]|uniref:hypothetical protein n=1 Tax=Plesiomonas shigelloides TaxID=703 RepID=UPI0012623EE9|nr:hypothetical protein [Plesiomonas shigelloides]KAB7657169.1 hypothetical protein GBN14_07330 [Plesiomonas shigelloides]
MKIDELAINSIYIIENLRQGDLKTGKELKQHIDSMESSISVEYFPTSDKNELFSRLELLIEKSSPDEGVILFFETHGSREGIDLAGELVSWEEINDYLSRLNDKTCMGLIVVFSCCFGVNFYKQTTLLKKCPYYLMLGFDDKIKERKLIECNKKIIELASLGCSPKQIEVEVNLLLPMTETKMTVLDAGDVFYNGFKKYLISSSDEDALYRRAIDNYRVHFNTCIGIPYGFPEFKEIMYRKILSRTYLEEHFYRIKDRFLLTDKYLDLNCRFSAMFDELYDECDIESKHLDILEKLT